MYVVETNIELVSDYVHVDKAPDPDLSRRNVENVHSLKQLVIIEM